MIFMLKLLVIKFDCSKAKKYNFYFVIYTLYFNINLILKKKNYRHLKIIINNT